MCNCCGAPRRTRTLGSCQAALVLETHIGSTSWETQLRSDVETRKTRRDQEKCNKQRLYSAVSKVKMKRRTRGAARRGSPRRTHPTCSKRSHLCLVAGHMLKKGKAVRLAARRRRVRAPQRQIQTNKKKQVRFLGKRSWQGGAAMAPRGNTGAASSHLHGIKET